MRNHKGEWAEKIFVGSGTREYSATRDHEWYELDQLLLHYSKEVPISFHTPAFTDSHALTSFCALWG